MEENYLLNDMHQKTKTELQEVIGQLQEQLKEHKTSEGILHGHIESLKADLLVKSEMQTRIAQLEEHMTLVDANYKKEVEFLNKIYFLISDIINEYSHQCLYICNSFTD